MRPLVASLGSRSAPRSRPAAAKSGLGREPERRGGRVGGTPRRGELHGPLVSCGRQGMRSGSNTPRVLSSNRQMSLYSLFMGSVNNSIMALESGQVSATEIVIVSLAGAVRWQVYTNSRFLCSITPFFLCYGCTHTPTWCHGRRSGVAPTAVLAYAGSLVPTHHTGRYYVGSAGRDLCKHVFVPAVTRKSSAVRALSRGLIPRRRARGRPPETATSATGGLRRASAWAARRPATMRRS